MSRIRFPRALTYYSKAVEEVASTHLRETGGHDVPCDGCTECCKGDTIRILPHEDASQWLTEPHPLYEDQRMLAHRADGACVYLGPEGCTIHDTKPQVCRDMDCRLIAQRMSWTSARKLHAAGEIPIKVWRRGRDLLKAAR